jgi:S1-C subfamily serine protease
MQLARRTPIISTRANRLLSSQRAGQTPPAGAVGTLGGDRLRPNKVSGSSPAEPALFVLQPDTQPKKPLRVKRLKAWAIQKLNTRGGRLATKLINIALIVGIVLLVQQWALPPRGLNQAEVDYQIEQALQTKPVPSFATAAYAAIAPSVVRVVGGEGNLDDEQEEDPEDESRPSSIGSGVVIVDTGLILTNLHVVAGAKKIGVEFADGTKSEARIVRAQPENDLAVIQATTLPDDLVAAKLGSTRQLQVGDHVMAVGFPFGIGPSASAGIVSGLKRSNESGEKNRTLSNLIQFDAAANPGNSGGPLVTAQGEVVGIVTGILNPTRQRVFIGIGFAVPIESAASAVGMPPF